MQEAERRPVSREKDAVISEPTEALAMVAAEREALLTQRYVAHAAGE
jgi:hypothetical protein